jgi:integrase
MERWVLNAFLRHPISRKPLSQVTAADFALYRDERLTTIKASSLERQLAPLHNLFEIARAEWRLPIRENPLDKVKVERTSERRERRVRHPELQSLLQAARYCRNTSILPVVMWALETGMRRGEILAMRWDHLDWEGRSLFIPRSKNGHSRTIPLTKVALGIVAAVATEGDTIFPISANALRLAWGRVRRRAKIENLRFHDLRHEAISRFFEKGLTTPEVALLSGHRDVRMLFRYSHALRRHAEKARATRHLTCGFPPEQSSIA